MYSGEEEQHDEEEEAGAMGLVPYKLCMLCVLIVILCAGATSRKRASAFEKQHPALARSLEGFPQDTQEDDDAEQGEQLSNVQRFVAYQVSIECNATVAVCTSNLNPESISTSVNICNPDSRDKSSGHTTTFLVDMPHQLHKHLHTCVAH